MNLDKPQKKRLEKLQKDAEKGIDASFLAQLTFPDLLLLLEHDPRLRSLIQSIAGSSATEAADLLPAHATEQHHEEAIESEEDEPPTPAPVPQPARWAAPTPRASIDPLREQLSAELALLQHMAQDAELAGQWLGLEQGQTASEGQQLVRLIARAAQWERGVVDLWDLLAQRCKQQQRAAMPAEQLLLVACLQIHNQIWNGRQASLVQVALNTPFDFEQHERGTHSGETIRSQWLPGLRNAGGKLQKKPLVATA